ncbi:glycosyltransferase family 2 protein [Chryseobacterium sp. MP_3.2]|uniref:glycosyltransferase family 2 protein n=1 Tax=Chryseobacterium sp. MP_3.2 TaxID=3071712 RepID=UPI002DFCF378|nr:glycosyltransferase involved in cell wall biosynthesis [Chryseobacterium sp. MP_3.2]
MQYSHISIIVPCYKQAEYLNECLQSVLDQTYNHWECLIINDGSPDATEEIAQKWVAKDARFKYHKKVNGGVASARNLGIEKAFGEWILPLDGDDKIGSEYLQNAAHYFNKGYRIIYCKARFFGALNEPFALKPFTKKDLLRENIIFVSGLYLKKDWENTKGYDENFVHGFEDWEFWIHMIKEIDESKVIKMDYTGFYYRRKEESRDTAINKNEKEKKIISSMIYLKHLDTYHHEFGSYHDLLLINKKLRTEKENFAAKSRSLLKAIRKNMVTKFLYTLIEKLQ